MANANSIFNYQLRMIRNNYLIKKGEKKTLDQVWVFGKSGERKEIEIRAVVEDGGEFLAKGLLKIKKNVSGVEAFLRYKVLLLGEDARAWVDPQLEIESNEIKASHAASVGRIDEEQLFYLMSRGLTKEESEKLIVEAFLK